MPIATPTSGQIATGGGAPAGGGSYTANPYTLNTKIAEISNDAQAFSSRVHREAIEQSMHYEMHYNRDSTWFLMPNQPVTSNEEHPQLNMKWNEPFELSFVIPDPLGDLTPENLNSGLNLNNAGTYDPLMDEARKILWRVGQYQYANLAAGITPTSNIGISGTGGAASKMTDGVFVDPTSPTLANCAVYNLSSGTLDITVDLGAPYRIKHTAIRFIQKNGVNSSSLPSSVQVRYSLDNAVYVDLYSRPISDDNGVGSYTSVPGDWRESYEGVAVEAAMCDLNVPARYIMFRMVPNASANIMIDELAVYGNATNALIGRNMFVGYLGDKLDFNTEGRVACTAIDVRKKLGDNNERGLTDSYSVTDTSDIIYSICTSNTYWPAQSTYNTGFTAGEIGWGVGGAITGLVYPQYQSGNNSCLGYCQELAQSVGWTFYPDGNGVLQLYEPPYRQNQPTRLFINALDGNQSVRNCVRHRSGKDLRNTIEITSGKVSSGDSGSIVLFEPNSVRRYGARRTRVTDPILNSLTLRNKAGNYVLRDYAWNLQTLECEISPSWVTLPREVHAFRAPARPNLFAKASTYSKAKRLQELWACTAMTHHFTSGEWRADATYKPYFPFAVPSPEFISLTPGTGSPDPLLSMRAAWNPITDPNTSTINIYVSSTSATAGFVKVGSTAATNTYYLITTRDGTNPLVNGTKYWVYITSVGSNGLESLTSIVLSATIGSTAAYTSGWTVTDLAVGLVTRTNTPDADGYYAYQFACTWNSPGTLVPVDSNLEGFKRMQIYMNPFVQPSPSGDPTAILKESWAYTYDAWEWHGDYIAPGLTWDRSTTAPLTWTISFRSQTNFTAGQKLYFRMFTSSATSRWRKWGGDGDWEGWAGNVTSYTF